MALDFIEINPSNDEAMLIEKFEKETDSKLYPGQDTRILIQLMVYYADLIKNQFNDAAKLNLVNYSRYPILDFIGKFKNCERLEDESDEDYIERILLAPEGFSVAGPEAAYKYFAISSHPDIVDVSVDVPDELARVLIKGILQEISATTVENDLFSCVSDFENEEIEITLKEGLNAGDKITVRIPHPYKINIYVLTKNGAASEDILAAVEEKLRTVRPLSDYVSVKSATVSNYIISGTIYLKPEADENAVKTEINEALNGFLAGFKNSLNKSIRKNKIRTVICSNPGVYDFKLETPAQSLDARKDTYYFGVIGEVNYERVTHD